MYICKSIKKILLKIQKLQKKKIKFQNLLAPD